MRTGIREVGPVVFELGNELEEGTLYDEWDIDNDKPTGRKICKLDNAYYLVETRYVASQLLCSY